MKRKTVIFIHGIGEQIEGYSNPLWDMLWKHNKAEGVYKYELFYYDIFKMMNEKIQIEEIPKRYGFIKILEEFVKNSELAEHMTQTFTEILKNTVSHVLYFLLIEDSKNAIINKFKKELVKVIKDATKEGVYPPNIEITIISHSLGTVVGYIGLHRIIGEMGLSLRQGVRIKNFFTLATPLGLIKEISGRLGKEIPCITKGIKKPTEWNPAKKIYETNVKNWYSYRHKHDPVASLIPLKDEFLNNTDELPFVFEKIHRGNIHSFDNYIEQARDLISQKILEEK